MRAISQELSRERDKVRYLQEMSSWQELAKMLAHEIKNPLTPIEVLVTSLSKAYLAKGQHGVSGAPDADADDDRRGTAASEIHGQQVQRVRAAAAGAARGRGSRAGTRAAAQGAVELADDADFEVRAPVSRAVPVRSTRRCSARCSSNIVRNGIEANPDAACASRSPCDAREPNVEPAHRQRWRAGAAEIADRMFDPYISTKSGKDNMGLGLAIVKKIVLEHGGDIRYEESGRPSEFDSSAGADACRP